MRRQLLLPLAGRDLSMKEGWDFIFELSHARGYEYDFAVAVKHEAAEIGPRARLEEVGLHFQDYLYAMIRILQPLLVVEAGVRTGVSTRFALEAMRRNWRGKLVSYDPCYPSQGAALQRLSETVHLTSELAVRWEFRGEPIEKLPIEPYTTIDIFVDDAAHDESTTQWMFDHAWPMIMPGGWFICDDFRWSMLTQQHYTFERNCAKLGLEWTTLCPQTGVVQKGLE